MRRKRKRKKHKNNSDDDETRRVKKAELFCLVWLFQSYLLLAKGTIIYSP